MRTTKLGTLVAAMLFASAPLALQAATPTTTTDIDKQATQLNATAENKGQTQVATKIASSFTKLAGSQDNALKLVQALRNGTSVTLTSSTSTSGAGGTGTGTGTGGTTSTSFTPPTGKMGWGNVFISLALAQDSLARAGITSPTADQLKIALMGGDVTGADGKTVTLKGILQMRADGMGWGQIAQASGTKVGPVVSSIKSAHAKVAALPSTSRSGPNTSTTSASGTTGKATAKGMATAAGTNANAGSKGLVTASGARAGGTVTHGNSANAPGRGIVNAAGSGAPNVTATTGSGSGQGAGVVNAGGGNAAGVSNAGGNGKGNAGGNGKGKGGG